jgi:hypothetical protein
VGICYVSLPFGCGTSFGFVRETNYGRLFDVRVEAQPGNLAYTSRQILPHTDNPYRDPVPTVQLLHCLRTADTGGETGLVDGFAAARELRATDRETFDLIAGTPVPFGYRDKCTVAVRRWDDQAKDPAVTPPRFAHFAALLAALART